MPSVDVYSSNALARPMSVQDYDNQNMLAQQHRQALQQGALAMQQTQAAMQEKQSILAQREGLRGALQTGEYNLADPTHQAKLAAQFPDAAPAFLDSVQKSQTSNAAAAKDRAQAAHATAQTAGAITDNTIKATEFMARSLPSVTNPTQLAQWYKTGIDQKLITPEQAQQEFSQIPINDPVAMKAWIAS